MSSLAVGLGRLTKVDLRKVFPNEAGAFTPWLAQKENLDLLGDAIQLQLQLEAQEKNVGIFRADILCKDCERGNWVLIENQIERTDHNHLGQLITYAAGLEAVTIVWIAQEFNDEHRAALDWLNQHTDEHINFFGFEIELWQINDAGPVAPKFNLVCQPNDWARQVRTSVQSSGSTALNQIQLRFWTAFREYVSANSKEIRCQKPQEQQWMYHSIGSGNFVLASVINTAGSAPTMRVEFVMYDKVHFPALEKRKEEIERELGFPVVWHNPPEVTQAKVYARTEANFLDESLWPEQHKWLKDHLELFKRVFVPKIPLLIAETKSASAEVGA